jgi:hypothetical protein
VRERPVDVGDSDVAAALARQWALTVRELSYLPVSSRTGWRVSQDALALYRLRWDLDDVAGMLSHIQGPHQQTEDTLMTLTELHKTLEGLTR